MLRAFLIKGGRKHCLPKSRDYDKSEVAMRSHEVLKEAFEKTSPKALASDLGVSLSLVYKWGQEQSEIGSGSRNPLDRLLAIIQATGDLRILRWLCEESGGYYVTNPPSSCDKGYEVLPATSEILTRFSMMVNKISEAAQDKYITEDEAEEIRKCWDILKGFTEGFVRCCEEGDFKQMENEGQ